MRYGSIIGYLLLITSSSADTITPVSVRAASEWGINIFASNLIDGSGLIDLEDTADVLDDYHDNAQNWTHGWHSGDQDVGIPGGTDGDGDLFTTGPVDEQVLEFDLGASWNVTTAHIWQQNQSGLGTFLAPKRGVDEFEIVYSTTAEGDEFVSLGEFTLEPEEGIEEVPAQVIEFENPFVARRIRFEIISALSGEPNEFVGLGEVRFEGDPVNALIGDFNQSGSLDAQDIDLLSIAVNVGDHPAEFDLTGDALVTDDDRLFWVVAVKNTFFGDANLDGEFNSSDFVAVFEAGEYEDGILANSTWATGDWNGDGEFDSSDFVVAFAAEGFEQGPREVQKVPEPQSQILILLFAFAAFMRRRIRFQPFSR